MSTTELPRGEDGRLRLPPRPSRRRKSGIHAESRAHAHAGAGPELYATLQPPDRKNGPTWRQEITEPWNARPLSLADWWDYHRQAANLCRPAPSYIRVPKVADPGPWPVLESKIEHEIVTIHGSSWVVRLRLAWGVVHVGLVGVIYTLRWATSTVPRALALAALIALAVWWPF